MKILSISGDRHVVQEGTDAHTRHAAMRERVEALDVFVWPQLHSWWSVFRAARTRAYTLVTAQDPFWRGLLAWVVSRAHNLPLNVQVHTDLSAHTWWRRLMARLVLRRADSVRVVSEKIKKQVAATGTKARTHVLPIYLDLERFRKVERLPHDRPAILWVGRFEAEKDPLSAIEVLREVRAQGVDAVLIMLGAGRLEKALRKAAKDLPVEFAGWQPPEQYLPVADVVLSTSRHESWGASIIEALAAGVPVVAPDVGIARDAGAVVVDRAHQASAVARVLKEQSRGELALSFLDRDAWVERWKETLV